MSITAPHQIFGDPPPNARQPTGGQGLVLTPRGKVPVSVYGSGAATAGSVLTADGAGGAAFAAGGTQATGAFSAYLAGNQTITNGAGYAKLLFDTEEYDVSGWFDSTTASKGRYTPQAAGVYRFNFIFEAQDPGVGYFWTGRLYKNGAALRDWIALPGGVNPSLGTGSSASANGTTDYFECFVALTSTGNLVTYGTAQSTVFQGEYVGTL